VEKRVGKACFYYGGGKPVKIEHTPPLSVAMEAFLAAAREWSGGGLTGGRLRASGAAQRVKELINRYSK
jgi:hypothetical protein